jgi:hypothetical protein
MDKFNLPPPLSVDSGKIRTMIKRIGEDMALDPELGQLIREPLKGKLDRVDPGINIFHCKFMTAPGCQFDVCTAALKKIEAALVEAEIPFAWRGRRPSWSEGLRVRDVACKHQFTFRSIARSVPSDRWPQWASAVAVG